MQEGVEQTQRRGNWLSQNICSLVRTNNKVSIYVWVGTCDFTLKEGRFISIKPDISSSLVKFKENLDSIKRLANQEPTVKLTFLQLPIFSITEWNKTKGHANPDSFKDSDQDLHRYIKSANQYIGELNDSLGTTTPKFNQDLIKSTKGRPDGKIRYLINNHLLKDGVHPSQLLAKVWMKNILKKLQKTV